MKLYGIVGTGAIPAIASALHRVALKELGLKSEFRMFELNPDDPDSLAHFCYETDLNGVGGFGVEAPYQRQVMDYLDFYDPLAKAVGSVNTVVNEGSRLIGHNTLSVAALQALQEKIPVTGKRVLLLGAGLTARAIAYSLKEFGGEVVVWSRTLERAETLAKDLDLETIDFRDIGREEFDIFVNATPVGAFPETETALLSADQIPPHAVVMDAVPGPFKTALLKRSAQAGAQTVGGDRILLYSAIRQFELWFGGEAPREAMEQELERLSSRGG